MYTWHNVRIELTCVEVIEDLIFSVSLHISGKVVLILHTRDLVPDRSK